MSLQQFLPFITDDQGRSQVEEGGVVVSRSIPNALDNSPQGWESNTIEFSRNMEDLGIIRSYITQLKFYLDGATIIRDWFYRKGIEAVLFFIWLKLDQNFGGGMKHRGWYKGEIDLSTFKDEYDGVEVNITEGGFYKQYAADRTIPYGYEFSDPEAVSLEADGMDIYYQAQFLVNNGLDITDPNYNLGNHLIDLAEISNEFAKVGSVGEVPRTKVSNSNHAIRLTGKYFMEATLSGDVTIKYKFTVHNHFIPPPGINPAAGWEIVIRRIGTDSVSTLQEVLLSVGSAVAGLDATRTLEGTAVIPVERGDQLYFGSFMLVEGSTGDAQFQVDYSGDDSIFEVDFKFRARATILPAFTVYDLGNKLVGSMTSGESTLQGFLKDDVNLLITSGDGIRGIADSGVQTTFNDYKKSVDAVKCIALSVIDNDPYISSRYDRFDKTVISALGECRNFKLVPATQFMYNKVEAGFPPSDIDDVNGKYSFINTYIWNSPYTRVNNVYDAKSVYQADPYVIEINRFNLDGKNTTDNKIDNNLFFIDAQKVYPNFTGQIDFTPTQQIQLTAITGLALKSGMRFRVLNGINAKTFTVLDSAEAAGNTIIQIKEIVALESIVTTIEFRHYKLRRKTYTITGIPSGDSVFNMELTSRRCLGNHLRWLRSSFDHMDNKYLTFQSTDKNKDVVSVDPAGNVISESADILIASMGDKVFLPYELNFEVESPFNLRDQLAANSNGYFDLTSNGVSLKGFPMDIKTDDSMLSTQEYILLTTADNNLTQLLKNR